MKPPVLRPLLLSVALAGASFAQPTESLIPAPPAQPPPPAPPARPAALPPHRIVPLEQAVPEWQARWELARVLSYLRRWDESFAAYRRVLAERPDDDAVRQDYGLALFWAGHTDAAIATLRAVPAATRSPEARLALADLLVGRQAFAEAEELYRDHLAGQPDDLVAQLKLAHLLSWRGAFTESLQIFDRLVAARPTDVQLQRRRALVLMWSGDHAAAADALQATLAP